MRRFEAYRFTDRGAGNKGTPLNADTFNPIWNDLDGRLADVEAQKSALDDVLNELVGVGLQRLQDSLGPLVQKLRDAAEFGFLIAQSSSEVEITAGEQVGFVIGDLSQRSLFTPTPFLEAASNTDIQKYASLRLDSYDKETGVLVATALSVHDGVGGDTISDDDWTLACSAAVLQSISDTLAATAADRVQCDADLTATAAHRAAADVDRATAVVAAAASSASAASATTSAGGAAASQTAAASSATAAAGSAAASASSQSGAATSATNAAASEASALSSKNAAQSAANAAAVSAANAATSEGNAATSEGNASTSATAAGVALIDFESRFLGAKAANPTTDNFGGVLITGAMYWNSVAAEMRAWNGSAWVTTYNPAVSAVTSVYGRSGVVTANAGDYNAAQITDFDTQVRTSRLDQMAAPTADVALGAHKITGLADPTNPQDAMTKAYADVTYSSPYTAGTGISITGASIAIDAAVVARLTTRLDQFAAPNASVSFNGQTLTNLGAPSGAQDAATKAYVDATAAGLSVRASVVWATAAALAANTYANGTAGVGATLTGNANGALSVDGNAPAVGARVLVKNEATASHNGPYTVTQAGDASHPYILTRAVDADGADLVSGVFMFCEGGTVNAGAGFVLTTLGVITVGTTALTFTQFSGAGEITPGTGLSKSGNTLSVTTASAGAIGGVNSIAAVTHQWISYIDTNGLPHQSQPTFADLAATPTTIAGYGITDGGGPFCAFGDGSDGNVTISSGTTTLARDMYYNNLTLSGTGKINAAGFRIFVAGTLDLSAAPAGAIVANGGDAGDGGNSTGSPGGAAGAAGVRDASWVGANANFGIGLNGGAGALGGSGAGPAGGGGVSGNNGGSTLASGAGGGPVAAGTAGASGGAQTYVPPAWPVVPLGCGIVATQWVNSNLPLQSFPAGGASGPGGSAGTGTGTSFRGGGSGGGGAGAGIIVICARTIARGTNITAAIIQAKGGKGGLGGNGINASTFSGGGGGGSGGGGGWVIIVVGFLTGSPIAGCIDISGGVGGNGGTSFGATPVGGRGGASGGGGILHLYNLGTGTFTQTGSVAGALGGAPTAGAGGVGPSNTQQVAL